MQVYEEARVNETGYLQALHATTATVGEPVVLVRNQAGGTVGKILVSAQWTAPDGSMRTGHIRVPVGTNEGDEVPILTTRDGNYATPPPGPGDKAAFVALGILAVIIATAMLGFTAARRALDQQRYRAWDAAWEEFDRARAHRKPT